MNAIVEAPRLISPAYRALNAQMHVDMPHYGSFATGPKADQVAHYATKYGCASILDYGCGKGTLAAHLRTRIDVREYDPAIPGKDSEPEPADLVVCLDVMEHIEAGCLQNVLDHLQGLANKAVMFIVSTVPAKKRLPDGCNAHLIVESADWWLGHFRDRWRMELFERQGTAFMFVGTAHGR